MLFVAAGVTDTKVRHSTGVATTNSTNKNPNANKLSWVINRVSQKTFFSSIILAVESLVRMGHLSHQKKFQNYRPINDP